MILHNQKGISMVEVLITVLIVAVGAVATIRFLSGSAYDTSLAAQRAEAATIAQSQIETIRDYQALETTSGLAAYEDIVSGSGSATGANTSYTVTWTVTTNTDPDYKDVDVVVSWTDQRGTAQSTTLSTRVVGLDPVISAEIM